MRRALIRAACAAGLLSLTACPSMRVDKQYVAADKATFDTVAPVVRALADEDASNDPDLSGVNGRAILLAIESWETRLQTALESK